METVGLDDPMLVWRDGQPVSDRFGDVYFSTEDGLAETRYVFLRGNGLPERWAAANRFVVAETGFGTGLNFLATLALWQRTAPPSARLHYLAVEKYPLSLFDLHRAAAAWTELAPQARLLLNAYPEPVPGFHRRHLLNGRVTLTLLFGHATDMLGSLRAAVDAWFLDGFAPSRNPAMWSLDLFHHVARLSRPGTTFATFTAAGHVRRALSEVGFRVEKRPGFGGKREMSTGVLTAAPQLIESAPWFTPPADRPWPERRAVVIGAGLAGSWAAYKLARRGWQVTLLERRQAVASEASGNAAGIVMPRLAARKSPESEFYLNAFLGAVFELDRMKAADGSLGWTAGGVLQLLDKAARVRLAQLGLPSSVMRPLGNEEATELAGTELSEGALYFPTGGWIDPGQLCRKLLAEPGIRVRLTSEALSLHYHDQEWQVLGGDGRLTSAPVVVVANAVDALAFEPTAFLPLERVRGQVAYLPETPTSRLRMAVCYEGYVTPAVNGLHVAGATFQPGDEQATPRESDARRITDQLQARLPGLAGLQATGGRVAFRTVSPDHLPLIGPVPDAAFYGSRYADLHHGRPVQRYPCAEYLPGLFVSLGHGSRGLVSAPLAAEMIVAQLEGEPQPMPAPVLDALHPGRFLVRTLRRRRA